MQPIYTISIVLYLLHTAIIIGKSVSMLLLWITICKFIAMCVKKCKYVAIMGYIVLIIDKKCKYVVIMSKEMWVHPILLISNVNWNCIKFIGEDCEE